MIRKKLILVVLLWCVLMLLSYYMPYFLQVLFWLGLSLLFFIVSVIQIIKLIKERTQLGIFRIVKVIVFVGLFYLTFFGGIITKIIERADWLALYDKRNEIVQQVIDGKLYPNVSWRRGTCELPYGFPIVSNGGNEIEIYWNEENGKLTVSFWILRNYFEAPSSLFIYTDDPKEIKVIEEKIRKRPSENWKIQENWYRVSDEPFS